MNASEAYEHWASHRGISAEVDAANWAAYQQALEAEQAQAPAKPAKKP